jgi:hypothetical protein
MYLIETIIGYSYKIAYGIYDQRIGGAVNPDTFIKVVDRIVIKKITYDNDNRFTLLIDFINLLLLFL